MKKTRFGFRVVQVGIVVCILFFVGMSSAVIEIYSSPPKVVYDVTRDVRIEYNSTTGNISVYGDMWCNSTMWGNLSGNLSFYSWSSMPTSPSGGDICYTGGKGTLWLFNGTGWSIKSKTSAHFLYLLIKINVRYTSSNTPFIGEKYCPVYTFNIYHRKKD